MTNKILKIDWRDKEIGSDEIPMSWFKGANTREGGVWEHAMKPGKSRARCTLRVVGRFAFLNYSTKRYKEFNRRNGCIAGVLKLEFANSKRAKVKKIYWKGKKEPRFTSDSKIVPEYKTKDAEKAEFFRADDKKVLTSIIVRRGQPAFREKLLQAYSGKCAISGCSVPSALEAAHIKAYAKDGEYDVCNGILLRSDLHTLFDLNLLEIDPKTLKARFNKSVRDPAYSKFHNKKIKEPNALAEKVSRIFLRQRRQYYIKAKSISMLLK